MFNEFWIISNYQVNRKEVEAAQLSIQYKELGSFIHTSNKNSQYPSKGIGWLIIFTSTAHPFHNFLSFYQ